MYEDSWYSFVPASNQSQGEKTTASKHRRRESLLQQPNENFQADAEPLDGIPAIAEAVSKLPSPPKATVARRAKSYSAFYDVVTSHIRKTEAAGDRSFEFDPVVETSNGQAFAEWYNTVEDRLHQSVSKKYDLYESQLNLAQSHMETLILETSSALDLLSAMSDSFTAVDTQTSAFRARCEGLISDQRHMSKLSKKLEENLQYYSYLEPISRRLNAPNASNTVRSTEFFEMLATLDHCLTYFESHTSHREAETYRSRYRLLMTRALTLIRNHFVASLKTITTEIVKRIADRQLNEATMSALLYAKFRVGATELRGVGKEVQKRALLAEDAESGESEYQSLMNELYQNYAIARGKLILPIVRKRISEIAQAPSTAKDLVAFARTTMAYVRGICLDEYQLWGEWFEGNDGLYDFLESICEPAYDYLRPRIIHETQILKLCELCTLLQIRYMREEDDDQEPLEPGQLDFSVLITPLLEDAQTRLVFRAQTILRDDIERYKPKPEVLQFWIKGQQNTAPATKGTRAVTSGRRNSKSSTPNTPIPKTPRIVDEAGDESDTRDVRWAFDTEAAHQGWYPTLRKAIWLLSRIYRLVNSTVFDDLAHQIVHQTTVSLQQAATQISNKATKTEGQLFLLKNLLLLKSQIVAFDIEFVTPEVSFDFSGVTNTFWELRERGGLFNPTNLFRLVGGGLIPRVVENMLDAKVELDGQLRTVINTFTTDCADVMTTTISDTAAEKSKFDPIAAVTSVQVAVQKELPITRRKLEAYLADHRTQEILVAAIKDQVIQNYEDFYVSYSAKTRADGRVMSKKGKGKEGGVWDIETFSEWMVAICDVDKDASHGEGENGRSRSVSQV